jgi:hypothetical protein
MIEQAAMGCFHAARPDVAGPEVGHLTERATPVYAELLADLSRRCISERE